MKRLLLFLMIAVFVVMSAGAVLAEPPMGENWGDLWQDGITDVLGVQEAPSYFVKPPGYGPGSSIPLAMVSGDPYWSTFPVDAVVIRTTQSSGLITGSFSPTTYALQWNREAEEMDIGTFDLNIESGSLTYTWDFSGVEGKSLLRDLSILSNDVEVASLDHVVVKVEENPTFDVFAGVENVPESLRPFGPISSTDMVLDLGLIVMDPDNGENPKMNIIFANFWKRQITITNTGLGFEYQIFAPDLYEHEEPAFVSVADPQLIDPALAAYIVLPENTLGGSSFDITFAEGGPLTLTWLWAATLVQDDPDAVGIIPIISSADINDDIDPDVVYVINAEEDFSGSPSEDDLTLTTKASPGDYIGQFEVNIDVPAEKQGVLAVLPLGLRFAIDADELDNYSSDLVSLLEEELDTEHPSEAQIIAALRKHLSFTKEWSDGTTADIKLNDPDFKDAVGIWVEFDEDDEPTFFFTVNLLIVNGGEPGMIDSASVNGRHYIVIYDGELDDKFSDPLKLTAATSGSSGGGGGCSALALAPGVGWLLLPLFMLRRK